MNKNEITKEQFQAYEDVRVSGQTNMFDIGIVEMLSGLEREEIKCIIENYDELSEKYNQ